MAIMYLSENTCPKEQTSLCLSVFNLSKTMKQDMDSLVNSVDPDQMASLVNSVDPDQLASEEASLSGSTLLSMKHTRL